MFCMRVRTHIHIKHTHKYVQRHKYIVIERVHVDRRMRLRRMRTFIIAHAMYSYADEGQIIIVITTNIVSNTVRIPFADQCGRDFAHSRSSRNSAHSDNPFVSFITHIYTHSSTSIHPPTHPSIHSHIHKHTYTHTQPHNAYNIHTSIREEVLRF